MRRLDSSRFPFISAAQKRNLARVKNTPLPGPKRPQIQPPNPRAKESLHLVAEFEEHRTNLPFHPLAKNDLHQRGRDDLNSLGPRPATFNHKSSKEPCRMLGIERPVEKHLVFLFNIVARMRQTLRQSTVIGEENQSLAVLIKPAHMKEPTKMRRHKIEDG